MNFTKRRGAVVDFIFVLALLGAFAVSALFVVIFGAKVFGNTTKEMDSNFARRTACFYVEEKLRAFDTADGVELSDYDGAPIIKLIQKANDSEYVTYLYMEEYSLMEYTVPADIEFKLRDGRKIVGLEEFEVSKVSDNILHVHLVDEEGGVSDFYKYVQCGIEGGADE